MSGFNMAINDKNRCSSWGSCSSQPVAWQWTLKTNRKTTFEFCDECHTREIGLAALFLSDYDIHQLDRTTAAVVPTPAGPVKCSCNIKNLMAFGCKCGGV